jgi:hypothetical protein
MVGGGGGAAVSRVTAERERARGRKYDKCGERECGPKILVRGPNARRTPSMRISLILVLATRVLVACLAFHCKGRHTGNCASCIDPTGDAL